MSLFLISFLFLYIFKFFAIFSYCLHFAKFVCLLKRLQRLKQEWQKSPAGTRQKLGLVWRNRKEISQIIKDYFCLLFFLLIILWSMHLIFFISPSGTASRIVPLCAGAGWATVPRQLGSQPPEGGNSAPGAGWPGSRSSPALRSPTTGKSTDMYCSYPLHPSLKVRI